MCHDLDGNQYVQHLSKPQFLAKFDVDDNLVGKLYGFVWLNGDSWPEDNQEFHDLLDIASKFVGDYNETTSRTLSAIIAEFDI